MTNNKVVLNITVVDALEVIANTIWTSALLLSFTLYVLNEGEIVWGQINATYFAGSIIGGLILVAFFKNKDFDVFNLIIISGYVMGILTFAMTFSASIFISLIASFLMGPIYQIRSIYQITALQSYTNDDNRSSIFSARSAILTLWSGIAVMLMGFLADILGISIVYIISGCIYNQFVISLYIYKKSRKIEFT